jgi:hypothetical protein
MNEKGKSERRTQGNVKIIIKKCRIERHWGGGGSILPLGLLLQSESRCTATPADELPAYNSHDEGWTGWRRGGRRPEGGQREAREIKRARAICFSARPVLFFFSQATSCCTNFFFPTMYIVLPSPSPSFLLPFSNGTRH